MGTATISASERSQALPVILWGGLSAGVLDISAAFIRWGKPVRLLQGIASGLLGPRAFQGGKGTAALGLVLHFFIAFSAAAVYYAASRRLAIMSWVVVPLSALPKSKAPFSMTGLVLSLLTHMFCVGLPIAFAVHHYAE